MRLGLSCLLALGLSTTGFGQILYEEAVSGDLSGNHLAPTNLNPSLGDNVIIGTTGFTDRDIFHLHLAFGMKLTKVVVNAYVSNDAASFLGLQAGSILTEDPDNNPNPANLLGYCLWGTGDEGFDLLPRMASQGGTIGFSIPLTGSDYTFWLQQGGDPTYYEVNFVTTPEPATLSLAVGIAGLKLRRRRDRKSIRS